MSPQQEVNFIPILSKELVIRSCVMGSGDISIEIPRYINMYVSGKLPLDKLVTKQYGLDEINTAFDDLRTGKISKGMIVY